MEKTKDAVKRMLKEQYEIACNAYVAALAKMWEWDITSDYGFWVANEVGGVYCYGEMYSMGIEDIIYCVENDIEDDDYLEYVEYYTKCCEYNFHKLSLDAWHKKAPRIPQETFDRLDALKKDLDIEINKVKEEF